MVTHALARQVRGFALALRVSYCGVSPVRARQIRGLRAVFPLSAFPQNASFACVHFGAQNFLLNTGAKICSLSPPGDYRNRADKTWKRSYVSILSANDDMWRLQHRVAPHHQRSGYAAQNAFSFFREKEGKKEVGFAYLNVVTT